MTLREIIVATDSKQTTTLKHRAILDLREFAIIFAYVYITLGAIMLMKAAVLHAHGIDYVHLGSAAVKAAVLAKFIMLGHALKIGDGDRSGPLIWPTLYGAFTFMVLLVVMSIIEEAVVGLIHHRSIVESLAQLAGPRLEETVASIVITLLVLIPYFAFRVLGEVLGEGRLARMFFVALD
jgi:hypothetical protein